MFTARYVLIPYIEQITFIYSLKGRPGNRNAPVWECPNRVRWITLPVAKQREPPKMSHDLGAAE